MKPNNKVWLIIISLICVVYVLLRLWHLADSCLWFDEIYSIHAAEHDWRELPWFVAQDLIHPPLFYVLLKIWILTGGESLFRLRLFPVLFAVIAVIPFILLCRQLKLPPSTTALALTFFAAAGSLVKYAQEVRMYSLFLCLGLFSTWLFARFLNRGKGFWLLIFVNVLLTYTHYFGWLIVLSEVLAVLILARERLKRIFLMLAVTAASFTPWIFAVRQAARINSNVGQNIGWMSKPNLPVISRFVFDLFEPIYFERSNQNEPTILLLTLPILIVGIIAFGFYFAGWKSRAKIEKRNFSLLLIFTLTPISAAFLASWILPYSIWGTRHLIIVFAPLAILSAAAFSKIQFRLLKSASLSIIFLLFAGAFLLRATSIEPPYIWCGWENLAARLPPTNVDSGQGDLNQPTKIYVFEDLVAYHFWFALRAAGEKYQIIKVDGIEGLFEDKAYFLPRGFDEVKSTGTFEREEFFVAFRDKDWNPQKPPLRNLIETGYRIGEPQVFEAQGLKAFLVVVEKEK